MSRFRRLGRVFIGFGAGFGVSAFVFRQNGDGLIVPFSILAVIFLVIGPVLLLTG
jgi:hypothetical protein